jgi:hypothetical protein
VSVEWLPDDLADGHPVVQARLRVLKHHLCVAPPLLQVAARQRGDVGPVEGDRPIGGAFEPDERSPERALSTAGLSDQSERLAAAHLEVDAVDGFHRGVCEQPLTAVVRAQTLDLDERLTSHRPLVGAGRAFALDGTAHRDSPPVSS